uniref:SH3 domain-containing protein n=2 Tax=Clastoptera arizonana TaxID=38151 RepID=A0A1B6DI14_9HEMI
MEDVSTTGEIINDNEMLRALYDFTSDIPQTLGFKKDDQFILHPSVNKQRNWWHVISINGQVGYVPNNYVHTVQVPPKVILDFLTSCLIMLEKDVSGTSSRKQELISELRKRRHAIAVKLGLRGSRSPLPPQRTSSSPTTSRCNSALAFSSSSALSNSDVLANLGKHATLPKTRKNAPKKPVRTSLSTSDTRGESLNDMSLLLDEPPFANNSNNLNEITNIHETVNEINVENIYNLVQEVRFSTSLNYELSKVAVGVIIKNIQEFLPPTSRSSLKSIENIISSELVVPEHILDKTHDSERLITVLSELVSCKEDAQQRSWELYEDEHLISANINELSSIVANADPSICQRVLSSNKYSNVCTLLEYYQMEVRWSIRELLLQAFHNMCNVHPPTIHVFLNSVLPMELARDMLSNSQSVQKLIHSASMLITIFSRGEAMPITHLEFLGCEFVEFVLQLIEEPPNNDVSDTIPDIFLQLILSYNLQFQKFTLNNIVINALGQRANAKVFTEKVLLLLNREDDPVKNINKESSCRSVFKIFHDLFSTDKTASLFYTNDIKVLIDIIIRQLSDISPGDERRTEYLELCRMVLRNTNYTEHKHRVSDLQKCFTRVFCEDSDGSKQDQILVRDISNEFPQFFKG